MCESTARTRGISRPHLIIRNWTCRLCSHSNPDSETICCLQCGAAKR
ncbi:hypothetical protein HNR23_001114 [Nocardiopsis mwathae]|uniref:RanBP2-type domain-containing protein n=1 Tax=Nocardiopsis mwathae TaxID=1472723 RepID=A0A7W9YF70_9ACTN|nr:hypothetical protein [Nocardiopsis mwathae]MBB6171054.1 hypothetical protein [Nocardiopsis mwathae]